MQTELIETFLDLCETRSFNRTAERLGIMQSTVSGRIRALEAAVGRRILACAGALAFQRPRHVLAHQRTFVVGTRRQGGAHGG